MLANQIRAEYVAFKGVGTRTARRVLVARYLH